MADSTRLLSESIQVTLTVTEDVSGTAVSVSADSTPTAKVYLHSQVVSTITASDVSSSSTGVYSFTLEPSSVGTHVVEWAWTYGGTEYESEFRIQVLADPAGTVTDDSPESPDADPAIGSGNICTVTGSFYDAHGEAMQGVYVRFTPLRSTDSFLSTGIVAKEATASSDSTGSLSIDLVRNVTGTLSISGIGLVREVTVPDVGSISIKDLAALGSDLLEVQTPTFISLPRRS